MGGEEQKISDLCSLIWPPSLLLRMRNGPVMVDDKLENGNLNKYSSSGPFLILELTLGVEWFSHYYYYCIVLVEFIALLKYNFRISDRNFRQHSKDS